MAASNIRAQRKKVLVVDDEPQIVEIVERYLSDDGFDVAHAFDGVEAVKTFDAIKPDLVVLDLTMPVKSGLEVFHELRSRSAVPIIMLTSRADEVDRVVGLELGADDYITKPFSPREVVARVKTVLRRVSDGAGHADAPAAKSTPIAVRIGDLEIDSQEHEVRLRGDALQLTPTEFRILEVLAGSPGRTFTRTQLLDQAKGDELEVFDRTLDRHIANLRHKIEEDAAKPKFILTVFGVGYKMAKNHS
jgi:two-component system alkaline phosphatase synthesis response regulator PhoP